MGKKVRETSRQVMALLLVVAMCAGLLPGMVLAESGETAEGTVEENVKENYELYKVFKI